MKRLILNIFLLFVVIFATKGQDVTVTSVFDTSRIFIGDQVNYIISVDQASNLKLELPFFKDSLCKNIEILSGPVVDSSRQNGRIKIIEKYFITSFDSGFYQVPPVFAELKNENGVKRFYSDYARLEVMRVQAAPADTTANIYDIIKPYRAPVTIDEILPWILIVALLGTFTWFAIQYIKRLKKSKKGIEPVINPDPAHMIAFRELEKLRSENLWQKGEIKNYYTKLTEILRQYLENRYGVFSLELTTAETLQVLLKTGFKNDSSFDQLRTVLTGADLIKFAKYNPEPSENESHFQNSWDFVIATKQNEVIKEEEIKNDKGEGSI